MHALTLPTLLTLALLLLTHPTPAHTLATGATRSPTSSVAGKAFSRFVTIWLENTDYAKAAGDPSLAWLAARGITLSNYFAVTHPSEPNYVAAVAGDYFGINNDDANTLPANVSCIADLLDARGVSWGSYQEDMPYAGFTASEYRNPLTKANAYVRKHNPLVMFESVAADPERLALIKNLTWFGKDLEARTLPQWMFITPNMTSDGHDSSVTVAGSWTRAFLEPLLDNEYFMKDTLILVTFDENHSYTTQNRVFGILLGGAVPADLVGTTDSNYYDHYSEIATVEANWGLSTLGRFDVGANVFAFVANATSDTIRAPENLDGIYLNESYPGIFNNKQWGPQPAPNTALEQNGRAVLQAIKDEWEDDQDQTYYTGALEVPSSADPPTFASSNVTSANSGSTSTSATTTTTTSSSSNGANSLAGKTAVSGVLCGLVGTVWMAAVHAGL